jgi:hypothetical protein
MLYRSQLIAALVFTFLVIPSHAQSGGMASAPGWAPGMFDPGSFDPATIQSSMMERQLAGIQQQLDINAIEWQVLKPRIGRVLAAREDVNAFAGLGRGYRGRGSAAQNTGLSGGTIREAVVQKTQDLQSLYDDHATAPMQFAAKLSELRNLRRQAVQTLTAAENDLRDLLTARQEAGCVMLGILE